MNRAQFLKTLLDLRANYWFIPSLMVAGAIVLSIMTVWLDSVFSSDWPQRVPLVFSNKPDGARSLLATVAGSMITVAGVTFSLTLLAVSHATAQFGPRLLNNFMRDRGNQITLGTFVATFIYCLLVLRTVRSADEPASGAADAGVGAFVPHISITVALILTLCSVGVLIYFIHHVPESIRLSNVVSRVGHQLYRAIGEMFPETIANPVPTHVENPEQLIPPHFFDNAAAISLPTSGYIQSVDEEGLIQLAQKLNVTIFMKHRPGDFYCQSTDLILVSPAEQVSAEQHRRFGRLFALDNHRTISQNVMFAVDQLVEVAQRALSPGINDPTTAMVCIDWLKVGLVELSRRKTPTVYRFDDDAKLRLFTRRLNFEDFCSRIFDQLRQYVSRDRTATFHLMKVIKSIRNATEDADHHRILDQHAQRLIDSFESAGFPDFDVDELHKLRSQSDRQLENSLSDSNLQGED